MYDYEVVDEKIIYFSQLPWKLVPFTFVLDPFAGEMKVWKNIEPIWLTATDINPSKPTIHKADASNLPFADNVFDAIWTDPPHLIRNDLKHWNKNYLKFGNYKNRKELEKLWPEWSTEFHRVTRPGANLMLKTVDGPDYRVLKVKDLEMFSDNWTLLDIFGSKSGAGWSKTTTIYSYWERK